MAQFWKNNRRYFIIGFILINMACDDDISTQFSITGTVTDSVTGDKLNEVLVELVGLGRDESALTDSSGTYIIEFTYDHSCDTYPITVGI